MRSFYLHIPKRIELIIRVERLLSFHNDLSALDFEKTINEIIDFIRRVLDEAKASGVVVGLSGGVDSSLTAALCVRALGAKKVLGILMPTSFTPKEDIKDAYELAEMLKIKTIRVDIDGIFEAFLKAIGISEDDSEMKMPLANLRARIRMMILYFYANAHNMLVAGTGDLSELLIGFFTKHGDGAADFLPIVHLYKTQVRKIAKYLGIPDRIAFKPSSPQLYPGHKLLDEVPIDYDKLDPVLVGLFKYELPPEEVSRKTEVPLEIVLDVKSRYEKTKHKRELPSRITHQLSGG
ncbi:TPA: NAD+ synthase [Candidatus Bathyarchaeota archaeon]|nr:NAD+ synthase [Candidatus Bathyarchaeota archaeon]